MAKVIKGNDNTLASQYQTTEPVNILYLKTN